jgi:glycosyltransferase involved in cell wall biosynthesis
MNIDTIVTMIADKHYGAVKIETPAAAGGKSIDLPNIHFPRMKIAQLAPSSSGYNGIGAYTARLSEELRLQDPQCAIITLVDYFPRKSGREPGNWGGRSFPSHWPDYCLEAIDATLPQVVHIQHGVYMGHGHDLTRFLDGLRARRIPCVVTLHGVWSPRLFRHWPASFYHLLAVNVEHVIVHQDAGNVGLLQENGFPIQRIMVIPHGTWTSEKIAPGQTSDAIGMTTRKIVLFAGNIFQRKGLHVVLQAFPAVMRRIPEACLQVVGKERTNNLFDRLYRLWLHARMQTGLKDGWLLRCAEYVPEAELSMRIAAAHVVVFPYLRRYGSASGIFHRVLAFGRPAICSNIPTFAEAIDTWGKDLPDLFPAPGDVGAWSRSLIRILSDESFRTRAMEAAAVMAQHTQWPLVARQHLRMYRALIPLTALQDVLGKTFE